MDCARWRSCGASASPQIQNVIDSQEATQAKIAVLLGAVRQDVAEARRMIDDMNMAVVAYLLRGDINFKSFVQELVDCGESIDPSEADGE